MAAAESGAVETSAQSVPLEDSGAHSTAGSRIIPVIFAAVTFLNAALLFAVQPMFSKMVLPLLGGTPMVWNTCLLFFQAALLAGYLYAHASSRWLPTRRQGMIHLALLVAALLVLPLTVPRDVDPPAGLVLPVIWLLGILTISLGLPFVLLAAGAPMFQRWLASTSHRSARNPYVLYVASNLGSFVALIAYPTLIEPTLAVTSQTVWWLGLYYLLIAFVGVALWFTLRWARTDGARLPLPVAVAAEGTQQGDMVEESEAPEIVPTAAWRLRWVLLSFAPSSLLIGVTTYLSTDVAAVPLLWVVPLALYLLTFVIVFAERPLLGRGFMLFFHVFAGLALLLVIGMTTVSVKVLALHIVGFFAAAMVCHRELADSRPAPEYLTEFYLWMSVGGLLGGVFNVLVAPMLYNSVLEYPLALLIAFGLRPALGRYNTGRLAVALDLAIPLALYWILRGAFQIEVPTGKWATAATWGVLGSGALAAAAFYRRPLRLALAAGALFFAIEHRDSSSQDSLIYQRRSFFGVYKVHRYGQYLLLQHGTTTHGAQNLAPGHSHEPLTYYHRMGPLGDLFAEVTDTTVRRNVALVGLGTGTSACYAHQDEEWTFYEIDPVVVEIASSGALFTYLKDCAPQSRIVVGDARLSLEDAPDASYDMIVLDAFSSDAIPVHLITKEALALYLKKLKDDGTIAFHISNRYLDLEPVLVELARDARMAGAARDAGATEEERASMYYASRWVALSRHASVLSNLVTERGWNVLEPSADVRLWTDDFTDIIGILKH